MTNFSNRRQLSMTKTSIAVKWLTLLTFLYGGLLLYASLMPYDFTTKVDLIYLFRVRMWEYWPFNLQARISGSDFVSNLLLYTPLGFLLSTRYSFFQISKSKIFVLTFLLCCGLSLLVEILQGLMVSRTPSATDWLLNSISGSFGAIIGVTSGYDLWHKLTIWLKQHWQSHPLDILTLIYMALLTADALSPFLPTILLSQLSRNLKNSYFNIIEGWSQHPWHWWFMVRIQGYAFLTFLLASWGGNKHQQRNWSKAIAIVIFFSFILETAKLIIVSQHFNLANIASAIVGVILAVGFGRFIDRLPHPKKLELTLLLLLSYEFYLSWQPFNFIWDIDPLKHKIPSAIELLPFYHYAMGATLNHARLFVQIVVLQGFLVYLVRMRFTWIEQWRPRLFLLVILTGTLGLLQEGGQMFLPSRVPSLTDVYCFMIGAIVGASLPPLGHKPEEFH